MREFFSWIISLLRITDHNFEWVRSTTNGSNPHFSLFSETGDFASVCEQFINSGTFFSLIISLKYNWSIRLIVWFANSKYIAATGHSRPPIAVRKASKAAFNVGGLNWTAYFTDIIKMPLKNSQKHYFFANVFFFQTLKWKSHVPHYLQIPPSISPGPHLPDFSNNTQGSLHAPPPIIRGSDRGDRPPSMSYSTPTNVGPPLYDNKPGMIGPNPFRRV